MAEARAIIGRDPELRQLAAALEDARHGRGGVWFVTGEPGIGKTRLVEELAERAQAREVAVLWGRCWEAGGAPAYWPWIEVLRALLRKAPAQAAEQALGARASVLAQLLPELAEGRDEAAAGRLGGERGRFELLDSVARALCDAAHEPALLVIIEDLHVADDATVSVLELLLQQARSSQLLVVGTLRDTDTRVARSGTALTRLIQGQRRIELARLGKSEVGAFLAQTSGGDPSTPTRDAVFEVTDLAQVDLVLRAGIRPQAAQALNPIPGLESRFELERMRTVDAVEIGSGIARRGIDGFDRYLQARS